VILFQDNLVLVGFKEALEVFDLNEGKQIWKVARPDPSELPIPRALFLGKKFCGYVYDKGFDPSIFTEDSSLTSMDGEFRVAIYETTTGEKVDDILCWEARIFDLDSGSFECAPFVKVSSDFLCIYGYSELSWDECPDKIFCLKITQGKASFIEGKRLLDVDEVIAKKRGFTLEWRRSETNSGVLINSLKLVSMTFWGDFYPKNVIFFELRYWSNPNPDEDECKSDILVLDLEKALDGSCVEPADAVTTPLPAQVLQESDPSLPCLTTPMFKSLGNGLVLTGALQVQMVSLEEDWTHGTIFSFDQQINWSTDDAHKD
jgi:hypothetical protein